MWRITEFLLANFYGPSETFFLDTSETRLVYGDDLSPIFVTAVCKYDGWIFFGGLLKFKRKVGQGVSVKGIQFNKFACYYEQASMGEVVIDPKKFVSQAKNYIELDKGSPWESLSKPL